MLELSPRQFTAYLSMARRRYRKGLADNLGISALGSRGEPTQVKKTLRDLEK